MAQIAANLEPPFCQGGQNCESTRIQYSIRSLFIFTCACGALFTSISLFGICGASSCLLFLGIIALFVGYIFRRLDYVLVGTGTIVLAALVAPFVVMVDHAVPAARLERVCVGMNESNVRAILGAPRVGGRNVEGIWVYHKNTWCIVRIHFASDGRVKYVEHDH